MVERAEQQRAQEQQAEQQQQAQAEQQAQAQTQGPGGTVVEEEDQEVAKILILAEPAQRAGSEQAQ